MTGDHEYRERQRRLEEQKSAFAYTFKNSHVEAICMGGWLHVQMVVRKELVASCFELKLH